jgi:pimeloyl-ACP methyl ester carboxylesterase
MTKNERSNLFVELPRYWIRKTLGFIGLKRPPLPTGGNPQAGLIWMFPGVEGGAWQLDDVAQALRDEGFEGVIRILDWTRPLGILLNLVQIERNRRLAVEIAQQIVAFREENPDATIDLVGYSGGGGMAVMVAEALPPGVRLRNVVLVQTALSRRYDLTPALWKIDGQLVNFNAPLDWLFIGIGTLVFGTMDRVHAPSIGKIGVWADKAIRLDDLRSRFRQIRWRPEMMRLGHLGGHLSLAFYAFNRRIIVPFILAESQNS